MSLKDEPKVHSVALEFELPGTPEQVWQAIATGPGIGAWFVSSEVEEREGGAVVFHLAPNLDAHGTVTAWEPPRRFAYEEPEWSEGAAPLATEFVVEAIGGGSCRVRLVHSLFADSDRWDDELEGMKKGWGPFFEVLRIYLTRFAGTRAVSLGPTGYYAGHVADAWSALKQRLGLQDAQIGARVASPSTAPTLAGVVAQSSSRKDHENLLLLLEAPSPGVALLSAYAWAGKVHLTVSLYFYGAEAAAAARREAPIWSAWMVQTFPAPSA